MHKPDVPENQSVFLFDCEFYKLVQEKSIWLLEISNIILANREFFS